MQRQAATRVNVAQASAGPWEVTPSTGSRQLVLDAQWPFLLPIHLLRVLLLRRWAQGGGAQSPRSHSPPGRPSGCLLSSRTTFKEFAEKYGRDQRFRLVQKRKDQEHFFNQFILILKKRDKENRLRLRKMR